MRMKECGIVLREERLEGNRRILNVSWELHHPSSGHTRFIVEVDGDIVVNVTPDSGYAHKTMEKLGE